jgi:hypothetical protein
MRMESMLEALLCADTVTFLVPAVCLSVALLSCSC